MWEKVTITVVLFCGMNRDVYSEFKEQFWIAKYKHCFLRYKMQKCKIKTCNSEEGEKDSHYLLRNSLFYIYSMADTINWTVRYKLRIQRKKSQELWDINDKKSWFVSESRNCFFTFVYSAVERSFHRIMSSEVLSVKWTDHDVFP